MIISARRFEVLAREAEFDLVGFARAEPIEPSVLLEWIAAGFCADLDWMKARVAERLDVRTLHSGAKTVLSLACNYWHTDAPSPIARYARGRDYHATMRDRLRRLRRSLRAEWPTMRVYTAVDANPIMEKVWAVRAGIGSIGKNSCLITPQFGSWVVLAAVIVDFELDAYSSATPEDPCGRCRLCIDSCPTSAIVKDRVVDARLCLSYQTIENEHSVPTELRTAMSEIVFGCDICQDVCPLNVSPVKAAARFVPRPIASLTARSLAAMSKEEWNALGPGTPLARAGYDGVRRNAAYALGAARDVGATEVLQKLEHDEVPVVREAARWSLAQLK